MIILQPLEDTPYDRLIKKRAVDKVHGCIRAEMSTAVI